MTRIVYVQTLELALSALKNAEPLMKHYPEPVARHKHAIEELEYAIEGGAPARLPRH